MKKLKFVPIVIILFSVSVACNNHTSNSMLKKDLLCKDQNPKKKSENQDNRVNVVQDNQIKINERKRKQRICLIVHTAYATVGLYGLYMNAFDPRSTRNHFLIMLNSFNLAFNSVIVYYNFKNLNQE